MPRISWVQSGSIYHRMEGEIRNVEKLTDGIYEVGLDLSGWHLIKTGDKFTFDYKVYHLQRSFIDHIKKTYKSTRGNLGVLFNGTRGTGKTVTAKILANELNLPIVLVKSMGENNPGLISYLSSFNFDCIFFFDEFEKQFNEGDCSILQIMDGVYNSEYRKVFLLTTNELSINENLLSRPSRIRYVREFGNLEKEIVEEFLDDELNDQSCREAIIDYVDSLTISTIDILKAVVEEVNIHGIKAFLDFKKSFNVESATYIYSVISGSIDLSDVTYHNYTVEMFLKEMVTYRDRFKLEQQFQMDMEMCTDDDQKDAIRDAYIESTRKHAYFDYDTVYGCEKEWCKLKPGVDTFDGWSVCKVDLKNCVVVTERDGSLKFYYIENPKAKPSIYGKKPEIRYAL